MAAKKNPIIDPTFAEHGKPEYLVTSLINTAEAPYTMDMLGLSIGNTPIWSDADGDWLRVNIDELIWVLTDVARKDASPEQMMRRDVQALLKRFGDKGPVEYHANFEVYWGLHDVVKLEDLEDDLVQSLGEDIAWHTKTGQIDVINVSSDALPTGLKVQARELDGSPICVCELDNERKPRRDEGGKRIFKKIDARQLARERFILDVQIGLYRAAMTDEERATCREIARQAEPVMIDEPRMTTVERDFTFRGNVYDLWRAHFEDTYMSSPKERLQGRKNRKRFTAKAAKRHLIGKRETDVFALCTGILPDDNCLNRLERAGTRYRKPEVMLEPGNFGKGKLFVMHPMAFNIVRGSALSHVVHVFPEWLPLHPSPFPREGAAKKAAGLATVGEVADAKKAPPPQVEKPAEKPAAPPAEGVAEGTQAPASA